MLVGFDANYSVRDIYFPRVGDTNQTMGNVCRTGFFIDGKFAWVEDPGWERQLGYAEDSLVTAVTLKNPRLGITVKFEDFVDLARNWFIRNIEVSSETGFNTGRVFFHYDWYIEGSDLGNTVAYDPRHRAVIAYKANRYFLIGGDPGPGFGIDTWANGKKGGSLAGTWVDAQDGELGRNPIEQGSVDCTVGFNLVPVAPGGPCILTHWVCMGTRLSEVTVYGQDLIIGKGPDTYLGRTLTYWQVWSEKDHRHIDEELGSEVTQLYRRCILTARTHVDNHGAIIAATDFDITKFARDTYAYAWPRDGALVANALDRAGHEDVTRNFFTYCQQCLVEEGFFLHKYTPYGLPGSSWLPWVDRHGVITLPIQEDETGLVLWALVAALPHPPQPRLHRQPVLDARRARRGLDGHLRGRAERPDQAVVGPVGGALGRSRLHRRRGLGRPRRRPQLRRALRRRCRLCALPRCRRPAARGDRHPPVQPRARPVRPQDRRRGRRHDDRRHGHRQRHLRPVAVRHVPAGRAANRRDDDRDQGSACQQGGGGGIARYRDDYYFKVEPDTKKVPGNPWFICTLWMAQWFIATANTAHDLKQAREIINWVVAHQVQGGLLSEQLDPNTGAPLSVSPLTWSAAELIATVDEFCRKSERVRRSALSTVPPRPA